MPEVWECYELPACLVDQYLAQPGDVCTAGLKIAFGAYKQCWVPPARQELLMGYGQSLGIA